MTFDQEAFNRQQAEATSSEAIKRRRKLANKQIKRERKAHKFISKKIEKLRHEGYSEDRAIAIAYSVAREKGYDVPEGTQSMEKLK